MATLVFYDQGHVYEVDGERYPSVSELCRFISREIYSDIPQWRIDHAADRGSSVHKACEALDKFGAVDVDDSIVPYLQAYLKFRKEHSVEWQKIEFSVHHPEDRYAGTIDRYGIVDGVLSMLDIKTSHAIHTPLCSAQLNLYRRMLTANGMSVDSLFILHLKKDGSYVFKQFDFDDTVPDGLLALHRALEKKRRKRKNA